MNGWLWAATVLAAALVPLLGVAALSRPLHGLIAVEAAGVDAALALLLLAEGTKSQSFASLALILGVLSFVGMFASFDTPFEVTTSELAIELLFPADEATAEALRRLYRRGKPPERM